MISLRQLLDHAAAHGLGPAFNVNNLEQIQAIVQPARNADAPVILQASAARDVCVDRFNTFGCAGVGARIKPVSLQVYAKA